MKTSLISFLVCSFLVFGAQAAEVGDHGKTPLLCADLTAAVAIAQAATESNEAGLKALKEQVAAGSCEVGELVSVVLAKEFMVSDKFSVWQIAYKEPLYTVGAASASK